MVTAFEKRLLPSEWISAVFPSKKGFEEFLLCFMKLFSLYSLAAIASLGAGRGFDLKLGECTLEKEFWVPASWCS